MSIIYPSLSYDNNLALSGLTKLSCRREEACKKLLKEIVNTPDHKLAYLFPPKHETKYNLVIILTLLLLQTDFQILFFPRVLRHLI